MTEINFGESISWWMGIVVNVKDPKESGRVQVRVFGRHDDTTNIPDDDLPWALIMQPATSAAIGKIGTAPVGLVKGSRVVGLWLDSDHQYPMIMGSVGKSGDIVEGETENGAPKVDYSTGSIPSSAQASTPHPYNPYTALFNGKVSIADIDAGLKNIFSVKNTTGGVVTKDVEKGMSFAKIPTIVSIDKSSKSNILKMINSVDPTGSSLALPCLGINFDLLKEILDLTSSLANSFRNLMAQALQNAILNIAKKLGLFKVLDLLNTIAKGIKEVSQLINSFNVKVCGVNILNQGLFSTANYALASALNAVNTATGYVIGAANAVNQAVVGSAVGVFDNIVTAPLASVATSTSRAPISSLVVSSPPSTYVRQYSTDDPFPGYIVWKDSTGAGSNVYTPRNGEPNFSSANDHTNYIMQTNITNNLMNAIFSGNLNASFLQNMISTATDVAKSFAISAVLGVGFNMANAVIMASGLLPVINKNITNFNNQINKASYVNSNSTKAMNKFIQSQALCSQKAMKMKVAIG